MNIIGFSGTVRAFTIALAAVFVLTFAQTAEAQDHRFTSIEVEGNQRIETATILTHAGITPGETVSAAQLNAAFQRILDSGFFESAELEPNGEQLVIRVREYPTINQISIEGNRRLKDEDLMQILQSQSQRVYSPAQAEADIAAITRAYQQAGRLSATVTARIIRRSDNRVDLVFEVAEGRVSEIERISFVGNRNFSERRLRRVLETKQAGLLRSIIARDTFIADRLEFDRQVLTDFYQSRGFVDFQVLSVSSVLSRDRNAFFVTFNLREGQQFHLGEITASSDLSDVGVEEFRDAIRIKTGQRYSPTAIEQTIARLERLAVQKNLDFVRVDPRITRNDRNLSLDVDFAVIRGPRIFVERIDIQGNISTLDRVIRRQFRVVEGDPFNPREIREAAERIRALNFFSSVGVDAREGSSASQVVVDVDVEEQPTGSLSFGASYSVSDGVGFNIAFSERNFLGRGQSIDASINTTSDSQSTRFSFVEPYLFDRDLALGFSAEYATTDDENGAFYQSRSAAVSSSLGFPIGENDRLRLRYRAARQTVFGVSAGSSRILQGEAGQGGLFLSTFGYTYNYDTRRTGLNPDAGVLVRFGQDLAGLGGDLEYLRTTALLGAETRVFNGDVTLRAVFEGGALHMLSGQSRIAERFLLGAGRLRGFESNGVGPRDLEPSNQDALGGNLFAVTRLEAEFPLGLPEEYGIHAGLFFDAGSVWSLDNVNGGNQDDPITIVDDSFKLRAVLGVSIFWDTPLGPLRFNFSRAIKSEEYDREQGFDLTISTSF